MKTIHIFFLFVPVLLGSCEIGRPIQYAEFFIKNQSDYNIRLDVSNFYYTDSRCKDTTFMLDRNNTIFYSKEGFDEGEESIPFAVADSIVICFANIDSIVYHRLFLRDSLGNIVNSSRLVTSPYNPLLRENYSQIKHGNTYTYTYIFTNKDFEEAVRYNSTMK